MKLRLSTPHASPRPPRVPMAASSGVSAGCMLIIVIAAVAYASRACSGDDAEAIPSPTTSITQAEPSTVAPSTVVSVAPIVVPETSNIKAGFKKLRWGSAPTGMKYVGRGDGVTQLYEPRNTDCVELGSETICDAKYHFFRKKLFAVSFSDQYVTRGQYHPPLLPHLEREWGPGTAVPGGKEWRSRDRTRGLTIARWTLSGGYMGVKLETVKIWSERIDAERIKVEADSNSPDRRQLRREIEKYQEEQRKLDERRRM